MGIYHDRQRLVVSSLGWAILTILFIGSAEWKVPFIFGASLTLTGVFGYLIAGIYGWRGMLPTIAAYFAVDSLIGEVTLLDTIHIFEYLCIAFLLPFRNIHAVVWALFFWLIVSGPLYAFTLVQAEAANSSPHHAYMPILMLASNGITGALIADIVMTLRIWAGKRREAIHKNQTVSISSILFLLITLAVVGPFLFVMMIDGISMEKDVENRAYQLAASQSSHIAEFLKKQEGKEMRGLLLHSMLERGKLREFLTTSNFEGLMEITVTGPYDDVIASTSHQYPYDAYASWRKGGSVTEIEAGFYRWLPDNRRYTFDMMRWREGFFVFEQKVQDHPFTVITKVPIQKYHEQISKDFANRFLFMILFCLVSLGLSALIIQIIMKYLSKLAQFTTNLPDKLANHEALEWKPSPIKEFMSLSQNFRMMAERVAEMFARLEGTNQKLNEKTQMLQKSEEQLNQLAFYDTLTGLPNRHAFTSHLQKMLENLKADERIAIMFLDLDRFKQVNDTLGHESGDLLLREASKRIQAVIPDIPGAMAARLGGDEFVIVMPIRQETEASEVANEVIRVLTSSIMLDMHEVYVGTSIGISLAPDNGRDLTDILKKADMAMYAAKNMGGASYRFYSGVPMEHAAESMMLETHMRKALERDEFLLHYQPIVDQEGQMKGMEALIRWKHPEKGFITPDKFIPLAEKTGFILSLGEWILRTACQQSKKWQEEGYPPKFVSVNISMRQFYDVHFLDMVRRILEETGLNPSWLVMEITEGFTANDPDQALAIIGELNEMGIKLSIDDFGTGYSSLNRLKQLPIYSLKIDRSFVSDVDKDHSNASIVQAIIHMAHALELITVAEGIETEQELQFLQTLNCDRMQGYLFSKPISVEAMTELLAGERRNRRE